ncbi:MAG: ectonucleotide pyrophosphatase/phosphodiesterase [Sphingomonas sp.]|nr:ectonucleotide pyrophosphatase/phosphodiesterase [Sphingomonas sp.]MDX3884280.1 ectonucleotide pyrophosphatase/phosphodiesterase [Sphingomonas sp.]
MSMKSVCFLPALAASLALGLLSACAHVATGPVPVAAAIEERAPVTILVSIDGFRPDYLDRGLTPNLNALAAGGVKAAMRPSFPSKTFPNHYAIVTGLRPDRNGIVGNKMEDPRRPGVTFTLGDAKQALDPFWWDEAEPIWVTAGAQGVRTATLFWPGSEVAIHGRRPDDWWRYDENIPNSQRVDAVIDWLRRPAAKRPRLLTLYFDTVDTAGHAYGPAAAETDGAIAEVDRRIGDLVANLAAIGQPANIVVVSDHGMAATSDDRVIRIDRIVDPATIRLVADGPYAAIDPVAGSDARLAGELLKPHDHMQCWRKSEIPARFHFGTNPRVPAYLCLADPGWLIFAAQPAWPAKGGNHGYDNDAPDMRATFIAAGPGIGGRGTLPVFDNVDVYPLLARLAGIRPRETDGDPATLAGIVAGR